MEPNQPFKNTCRFYVEEKKRKEKGRFRSPRSGPSDSADAE